MPSWRDIASPQAEADLDGLVGVAIEFAQQQLADHGEFFPFAAAVRTDGEIEMIAGRPDPADEHPSSVDVIDTCIDALRSKRNNLRACAIVADVTLTAPMRSDAIRVDLEHLDGHALAVALPYAKKRRREINYGPAQAHAGHHRIWEPPDR